MADYDWFDTPKENQYETTAKRWRPEGLQAKFSLDSLGRINGIMFYLCRRGCGTLVHDPAKHIQNVCTTFNPVVGD